MKKDVEALLVSALRDLGIEEKPTVEYTDDFSHGEMTTNIAMVSSKDRGENPIDLANSIISKIEKSDILEKVEVAGPGFINFFLADEFVARYISSIDSSVGKTDTHKGKTIIVEHSSPNLFKPFHIGHVMNNAIGESIVRLSEYSGAYVKRLSFPSDVSIGIGKAVWSLLEKGVENLDRLSSTKEKLDFLGQCYVDGVKAFEENENVQEKVKEITRKIFQKEEGEEYEAYKKGKDLNLEYFINETKKLGSTFDDFIYESEAGEEGKKIVLEHPEVFVESEGAIIYKGEEDGLHTRVFINSEGYPTYEAKDIGLLSLKFKKYNPDISVVITDHEQTSHFDVVLSAAGKIDKDWKEKTIHRTHGRMTLRGKKMSSREGGVPIASDVLETLVQDIASLGKDTSSSEDIAISALKFAILRVVSGKNINFDPDKSLSFEGDSGPYIQYTYARSMSLLRNAKEAGHVPSEKLSGAKISNLEKIMLSFEHVVNRSIEEWAPHYITTYLLSLCREFNSWYASKKIIDESNQDIENDLLIAEKTTFILKNGLYLLGIKSPEVM